MPKFDNIKIVFLPANTISVLQPRDQGIISSSKRFYRQEISLKILQSLDEGIYKSDDLAKKITVLDAIHMAVGSWNRVSETTVKNCFKKDGFISNSKNSDNT